MIIELI